MVNKQPARIQGEQLVYLQAGTTPNVLCWGSKKYSIKASYQCLIQASQCTLKLNVETYMVKGLTHQNKYLLLDHNTK